MKKTFRVKLDTEITIDFTSWGLSDAQQRGGYATKKLVVETLLEHCGVDDFEVLEKNNNNTLFEVMAGVVKAQIDYLLGTKNEFEYTIERIP